MENKAHALVVGVFTLLLAGAAVFAVWWMSGNQQTAREYLLVTRKNVNGLNFQAPVRYRGIRAGKVLDIDIDPADPRNILVLISVDAQMPVTRGTVAKLKYQGVTGLAYIQLEDSGENPQRLVAQGDKPPVIPLEPSPFDDLADAAMSLITQLQQLAGRANRVLSDANLTRVEEALAGVSRASGNLEAALKDISKVSTSLRQVLNEANLKRIDRLIANLEATSEQAAPMAQELRELVSTMQGLGERLEELSGAAGGEVTRTTLPRVNELLQQMTATSRQLSHFLDQIEERPNMLLFGGETKRPGPGESGFSGR